MCRWLMYHGDAVRMDYIITEPKNSLIHQSLNSSKGVVNVNSDGFGVGWYSDVNNDLPGQFRDPLPAWNNSNLKSLASHIKSSIFLAHVRATTGSPSTTTNCHPFRYENWLFMHNGSIVGFSKIRHKLESYIAEKYFGAREGCTDSEAMFLLALSFGLSDNPQQAIEKMILLVLKIQKQYGIENGLHASFTMSDSKNSFVARFSNDPKYTPSLFYIMDENIKTVVNSHHAKHFNSGLLVVSEPLDLNNDKFIEIENNIFGYIFGKKQPKFVKLFDK